MDEELLKMFDLDNQAEEPETEEEAPDEAPAPEGAEPLSEPEAEEPAEETEEQPEAEEKPQEVAETPQEEAERLWAGKYKSPEEMEAGLKELQSHKDREIAELQQKMQQYEQWAYEQQMLAQQQQVGSVTDDQLVEGLQQSPMDAFGWIVENQPERVSDAVSALRELHGDSVADQAMTAYNQYLAHQNQSMIEQQYNSMMEPQIVQGNIAQAMDYLGGKYGEEFSELQDDIANIIQDFQGIDFHNAEAIANALEVGFLHAWRQKATAGGNTQPAPPPSPQEFVETGTPGQEPVQTPEETIFNEIVNAHNEQYR